MPPASKLPVAIADLESTKALGLGSVKEDANSIPSATSALAEEDSSDDEGHSFSRGPSSLEIARDIYREKGWTGFWSGYKNSIVLVSREEFSPLPASCFFSTSIFLHPRIDRLLTARIDN